MIDINSKSQRMKKTLTWGFYEDHLVMMMAYAYTPMLLLEWEALIRMFTHLDIYI